MNFLQAFKKLFPRNFFNLYKLYIVYNMYWQAHVNMQIQILLKFIKYRITAFMKVETLSHV